MNACGKTRANARGQTLTDNKTVIKRG